MIHVSWLVAIDVCPKLENSISIGVKKKITSGPIQKDVLFCLIGTGQRSRWKPSRSSGSPFRTDAYTWFAIGVERYALIISRPRLRGALRWIPKFHQISKAPYTHIEGTRSHSKSQQVTGFSQVPLARCRCSRRFDGSTVRHAPELFDLRCTCRGLDRGRSLGQLRPGA